MFKKTKSSLAVTLSVAMLATMVTIPSVASAATGTQISGKDRYETALKIVQDGWKTSESAVIARGDDLADALSAAPLAYAKGKAPILLTKTTEIPAGVLQELKDLGVKNVYIVGGVGAVSKTVADQLAGQGLTITRVQGDDRYETSLAVAKQAFGAVPAEVVIANGLAYADALSVSSIAASKGMPILLVNHSKLSAEQSAYIAGKTVYAVGGEGVLNADVVSVTKAERLAGADRYATNAAVLAKFTFDYSKLYLAKGTPANLVDSLAGSALAAKTNSPIVLVDGTNKLNAKLATVVTDKIKDDTAIVRLGGTVTQAAADAVELLKTAPNVGELKVSSVTATSAKSFKVTFNKAVTDTSKAKFVVARATSPVTVTTEWNAAKTEAVLTNTANLPEAEYTINVKNDTTDLGTTKVAITQQKIAKINITSTKLGVVTENTKSTTSGSLQTGYATYNVLDQYGVDVSSGALGNNIQFNTGVGTITATKGLIKITPSANINLMTFTSGVVITANDTNTGVATTANLIVTSQVGTLSDIKLNSIKNADGKVLTAGDTTTLFYVDFTATDVSGNVTTNYDLIKKGLIYKNSTSQFLNISNNNVTAELKQDPKDSNKAVIEVRATNDSTQIDMDVVITAMTWTGKNSQITTKLKKQSEVYRLTLMAPSEDIASNEIKVIPYRAEDQNGVEITKFEDLNKINFNGLTPSRGVDGKLLLKNEKVENTGSSSITKVVSASVPNSTNGYSSLTLNIQRAVVADTLTLDNSVLTPIMQAKMGTTSAAIQKLDFGWDNGGLKVKDQFDRVIDMTESIGKNYIALATSSNSDVVEVTGTATSGQKQIGVKAGNSGSATVIFKLYDTTVKNAKGQTILTAVTDEDKASFTEVDSKSQTFTVLKNTDIKGYTMDAAEKPLFAAGFIEGVPTDRQSDYDFNPTVYGTTSTGAKVVLRGTPILGASLSNSDFEVFVGKNGAFEPDQIEVGAKVLADRAKTGSTAVLSVDILAYVTDDNTKTSVQSASTTIKSSTVDPTAESLDISYDTSITGVTEDNDVITVSRSKNDGITIGEDPIGLKVGNIMTRCDVLGSKTAADGKTSKRASIYFKALDQYGSSAMQLSRVTMLGTNTTGFEVNSNGEITKAAIANGEVTISASINGFIKTITLKFIN